MGKTKYTKLNLNQKLEIIDYWMKYHHSYSVISETFKNKWKCNINTSTVADIIQNWKKTKKIRGSSADSNNTTMLTSIILEAIESVNEIGYSISKECLHAICVGEFMDCDVNNFSVKIEDVENIVMEHQLQSALSNNHNMIDHSMILSNLQAHFHSTPLSSILFLDFSYLFFRAIPFKSTCYSQSDNTLFREKMEILLTFAVDGSFRSPAYIYGHRFFTNIDSSWSVIKRKKRKIHNSLSISATELVAYLSWLDQQFSDQHVLVMQNIHHLIHSIQSDVQQTIHFRSSDTKDPIVLTLHHLQVILVPPNVFAEINPFNQGIHDELVQGYRARLLQELIQKQQNNRGYKRQLSVETCYELLSSAWNAIPAAFISLCCGKAKLSESANELEWMHSAQTQLHQSMIEFHTLFKGKKLMGLSLPMYVALEINPFLAGISSIHECLRDKTTASILFNHGNYPQSDLFPEPSYFLQHEPVQIEDESLFQEEGIVSQPVRRPISQTVEAFCACLDGMIHHSGAFSESEHVYYTMLKQRLRQHYCKI